MGFKTKSDRPAPSEGETPKLSSFVGELVLVSPKELTTHTHATYGESKVVVVDYVVLTGEQAGEQVEDSWVFERYLYNDLKDFTGDDFLGRLTTEKNKWGKQSVVFEDPSPADVKLATKFADTGEL